MNPGKRFEEKFRLTMEPHAFVLRIPDSVYMQEGHIKSNETEADFIVVTKTDTYLVECKATAKKSLSYSNVKEHQEAALFDFDEVGEHTHGILAVEFYDHAGYRRPHQMFLLPISEWLEFKALSDRKSMPISWFEERGVKLEYQGSAYEFAGKWFKK